MTGLLVLTLRQVISLQIFNVLLTSFQNEDNTGTLDAKDEGILDLMVSKSWAIKLATEAARTVLSVDQIIVARQAGGPKPPGPNPVSDFASADNEV
jgi:hypothetical protein